MLRIPFYLVSPYRALKKTIYLWKNRKAIKNIQDELSQHLGKKLILTNRNAKGANAESFLAMSNKVICASLRITNLQKSSSIKTIKPHAIKFRLNGKERIQFEHDSYKYLSSYSLSPKPIYLTDKFLACEYINGLKLSLLIKMDPGSAWWILEQGLTLVRRMHELGVAHLDLNLGNIICSHCDKKLFVIDFEYLPNPQITTNTLYLIDYLLFLNDLLRLKRGGKTLLRDIPRLIGNIESKIPIDVRMTELNLNLNFKNLRKNRSIFNQLQQVIPSLKSN